MRCQGTAEEARLARKRKSVDTAETSWLQTHLKAGKDAAGGAPGRGRLQAIADTIIGNLQFSITNVHIRYEVRASSDTRLTCGSTPQLQRRQLCRRGRNLPCTAWAGGLSLLFERNSHLRTVWAHPPSLRSRRTT